MSSRIDSRKKNKWNDKTYGKLCSQGQCKESEEMQQCRTLASQDVAVIVNVLRTQTGQLQLTRKTAAINPTNSHFNLVAAATAAQAA